MGNEFREKFADFISDFSDHRNMVLSTSFDDRVTSRMMSVIQLDGCFYFQADITSRKAEQILHNKNVSLCIDNIQIDGICESIGKPLNHKKFCALFSKHFSVAYQLYTSLGNERLFRIVPVRIQKWIYGNGMPYIEIFDCENHKYKRTAYVVEE